MKERADSYAAALWQMSQINCGKVIKAVGGCYVVSINGEQTKCFAQKKVKYFYDNIAVGDNVEVIKQQDVFVINKILPRKNNLIRPAVANVDEVYIVLSVLPEPDFILADKVIINCNKQNIPVSLVINKLDITDSDFIKKVKEQYKSEVDGIYPVSSINAQGIEALINSVTDKTVCLCGQSAVGKTSILNAVLPGLNKQTGDLSIKTEKGKHTTRHNEIHALKNGGFIVDTAGFSLFDVLDIKADELSLYFNSFYQLSKDCRYNMCTHTAEPDCAVKKAVEQNLLDRQRYQRYLDIFEQLKTREKERFE